MNNQKDMSNNDQEIDRKRKNNNHEFQIPRKFSSSDHLGEEEDNDFLALSLTFRPAATRPRKLSPVRQQSPPPPPPPNSSQPPSLSMQLPPFLDESVASQHHPVLHLSPTYSLYMPPLEMTPPPPQSPVPVSIPMLPDSTSEVRTMRAVHRQESSAAGPSRPPRQRRNPSQAPREGKSDTVPAPYPWATTHRATVHSLNYLSSKQIFKISGEVQCKRCERQYEMEYDLREKFVEVGTFIAENKSSMHDRAPGVWMNPVLPACMVCDQENCVKPIISEKKKSINWLFLLLGQMLGCCTLEQLKYFCKHTKNHRTGAKDRVLYLTYLCLCKQLDPSGPFDR